MVERRDRFVRNSDEENGVPMAMYWTSEQVLDWIVETGYPQYRTCFETNFVRGIHLIHIDASSLPRMGITKYEHVMDIAMKVRALLGVNKAIKNMADTMSDPMRTYLEQKIRSGKRTDLMYYQDFKDKYKRFFL